MKKLSKKSKSKSKSKNEKARKRTKSRKGARIRKSKSKSQGRKTLKKVLSATKKRIRVKQRKNNEQIIAELRAKGIKIKDIAKITGISEKTLKQYRNRYVKGQKIDDKVFEKKLFALAKRKKVTKDWNLTLFTGEALGVEKIKIPSLKVGKEVKYIHAIYTVKFTTTKVNSWETIVSQVYKPGERSKSEIRQGIVDYFNSMSRRPYIAKIELLDFHINFVETWYTENK